MPKLYTWRRVPWRRWLSSQLPWSWRSL